MTARTNKPSLWRNRAFLALWGGQTVSEVGSQVTVLALPLVALVQLKATALQVGLLATAVTSAYLLVALPAGVLADRVGRRRLMLWCDFALLVVIGSVPAAQVLGVLTLAQLYATALISSVFSVVFAVAYQSYLPTLLDGDQLLDGNGKIGTSQAVAQLAGPGLGAGLVGLLGAARAMAADALSYLIAACCLLAIRTPEPGVPAPSPSRPRIRSQITEGLGYLLREPILRAGVLWSGTANLFVIMVEALGPVFLFRDLGLRPGYVGLLVALGAVGGIVGGVAAGPLARRVGSARISWLAMTVFDLPGLLIPAARPGWRLALFAVGWMSWTFAATLTSVGLTTYRQAICPPRLLGRVNAAARWVTWGTLPLGGLIGGALGGALGVRTTLWIAVFGGCASGLWLFMSPLRGMRDIPSAGAAEPSGADQLTAPA